MFNKTNHVLFTKYGKELHHSKISGIMQLNINLSGNHPYDNVYCSSSKVIIKLISGIVLMDVSMNKEMNDAKRFLIFRTIELNENTCFNFHCISDSAAISVFSNGEIKTISLEKSVSYKKIMPGFEIQEIIGCFYHIRNSNYELEEEQHDFWELNYVDNGSCTMIIEGEEVEIKQQEILIFAPGQIHSITTKINRKSCSYLTILFRSNLENNEQLNKKVLNVNSIIHHTLNLFVNASARQTEFDDELMLCYLKELLIQLQENKDDMEYQTIQTPIQQRYEDELVNEILSYMEKHICDPLLLSDICGEFSISRSTLQILFKKNLNTAPKQYLSDMKLNKSRLMIKEGNKTISDIAIQMGFSSINYFSKKFKDRYGIAPSDYAKTIYN